MRTDPCQQGSTGKRYGKSSYAPFLEAIKTAKSRPTVACWSEMDSELSVAVTDVMNGKKTAQEAMDKLAERFDELLAE